MEMLTYAEINHWIQKTLQIKIFSTTEIPVARRATVLFTQSYSVTFNAAAKNQSKKKNNGPFLLIDLKRVTNCPCVNKNSIPTL